MEKACNRCGGVSFETSICHRCEAELRPPKIAPASEDLAALLKSERSKNQELLAALKFLGLPDVGDPLFASQLVYTAYSLGLLKRTA